MLRRSCLFRTATNHQYSAQHLNVHAYSERQRTTNTVHNISTFMPIQNGNEPPILCTTSRHSWCCAQYWWFVAGLNRHERWDVVHCIGGSLPFWITNTVHNISTFMPIQNGNKPPILCTTSQHSCLFRTATNHQYHAQHLNVHAYSDFVAVLNRHERRDVVHSIGGSLLFWIGMNVEILCTVLVVCCRSE
jgi:hypothetical protein